MKKIKATYVGPGDNRWRWVSNKVYELNVYTRGTDRVWVAEVGAYKNQAPASYPDIMDFLTNWDGIQTYGT